MSKSQRSNHPDLFATLGVAIEQSGAVVSAEDGGPLTADLLYSWVVSTLNRERRVMPWLAQHSTAIMAEDGGFANVVLLIAGMALGQIARGVDPRTAVWGSAKAWRSEKRQRWDSAGRPKGTVDPYLFSEFDEDEYTRLADWLDRQMVQPPEPPSEWDGTVTDPRLANALQVAKRGQLKVLPFIANGMTQVAAAHHLGTNAQAVNAHMSRLRKLVAA